jgi:hypothetical protein
MVTVFGDHNVREESGSGQAAIDRPRRSRLLHNALAAHTGQFRPHMADHFEARRDVVKNLGEVLADLAHRATTVGTGTRRSVHQRFAREMLGQGTCSALSSS